VTVFVAVLGAAPGVGKSTLCAGLARALADAGCSVDHFREEEILSRPAYAAVAAEFTAAGVVRPETLLTATAQYVTGVTADVVVADALFPYLPSLRAWGHTPDGIAGFLDELAHIVRPVVLYVDGDPATALSRAAARETDANWLDWYVGKLAAVPGSGVHDLLTAAAHLRAERDLTLELLARWDIHVLPAAPADELLRRAHSLLTGLVSADAECPGRPGATAVETLGRHDHHH
jgi:hypothetical protein